MSRNFPPLVFLHLPKTAGQSIRNFLQRAFPKRRMFPGQLDAHLALYAKEDLINFDIFSGHFSWALLDVLGENTKFFTVMRDPVDRVISFYTYLQRQAMALPKSELESQRNEGLRAAASFPLEQFLNCDGNEVRAFVKQYFDNFYMYYFGTRLLNGRGLVVDKHGTEDYFVFESVLQNAIRNIESSIGVYSINSLSVLQDDLSKLEGYVPTQFENVNTSGRERTNLRALLPEISKDALLVNEQIHLNCQFDMTIYRRFCE